MAINTPLLNRRKVGGMFSVPDSAFSPGNHFWVDSGKTTAGKDDVAYGASPDAPFLTIEFAVGQCTASNGDIIHVMPGHAEVVATAGALDLDVVGISIIGMGDGAAQPTISFTHADADIDIDAANVLVENVHLIAGIDDVKVCFDVNADDFTVRGCRFTGAAVDENFLVCIQDAAAGGSDRITVENCHAILTDAANTHFVNFGGTGIGHIIRGNMLLGDWQTMCIGGAGVVTFCVVIDNLVSNIDSTNDGIIDFANTATGICARNMGCANAAQANGITATTMTQAENYYGVLDEDASAILDPPNV